MLPQADRPHIEIRPATFRDALTLVMRKADREEVEALSGRDPREVLVESVERSASAWAGLADGKLVCLFGVVPMSLVGVTGIPWLLGSDDVCTYGRAFLRRNRAYVHAMLAEYPVLTNVVDARNDVSIRWLRWLGFRLGEPQPMGPHGLPFVPFRMEAQNV
jgi:RimJ/RimL family protein N-acetyltransferase